ncbi:MAG: hypothetical protein QG570_620, partial [Patescibacteria group bacterium]|nr:hypothetical protein [Patescibacteria group bacterium]
VNYTTYNPSTTKYCGAYSPNMVNPKTDTNANKPYKTIRIPSSPLVPTVVATTNQRDQITLTWSYPSNPGVAYLSDVQRYRVYRGATLIADVAGSTNPATFRYVDTAAPCGANVTYSVRAETGYRDIGATLRSCGISAASGTAIAVGSCVPNMPPVCNIQYRNSAGSWVAYSNSLMWPKNTSIPVRLICTDPNNDPILRYAWSTSCGSISANNVQAISYLTLNQNGQACNLTGRGYDKITDPPSSDTHTVIVRTENPTPGTQVLSTAALGASCLSKSSPSTTAVSFNVTNYDDDSDGIATINNTLTNSVCGLDGTTRIGTCSFTKNSALSVNFPPFRSGTTTEPIRITLRTGSTPGSYGINKGSLAMPIRVSWDPYTGTTRNIDNTICVTDLPPTLAAGVVVKGSGNSNFNISANASDDWSLKGLKIEILNAASAVVLTPYENLNHFVERTIAQMTNANHTGTVNHVLSIPVSFSPDGSYRAKITVTDNSGRPTNTGVFTTAPFVIDRGAPACELISFSPTNSNHDGALNVAISSRARDSISSIREYRIYVKNASGSQVADSGSIPVSGNVPNTLAQGTYNWSTPLNLPRGSYTAYVDWKDSNDNATNTADDNRCLATYEIENPPVQILPSLVTVVEDSSECTPPEINSGTPFVGVNVRLNNDPTSQETKTNSSGLYSFPSANLEYGRNYSIELTGINDEPIKGYAACSGSTILTNFITPSSFNGSNNHLITIPTIKLYKQESTKWWQAYNGGVHSNIEKTFPLNGAGGDEGMPEDAVIIGNPTGSSGPPKGIDMYSLLSIDTNEIPSFDGGGLYSSFGTAPEPPPFYGNDPRNWGVPNLTDGTNSKMRFVTSIESMFDDVKALIASGSSDWKEKPNFNAAINSSDMSYVSVAENANIGGSVSNSGKVRIVLVEVANSKTVNIDNDLITSELNKPIILYVKGNILVKQNVTELNSVFLIATGTIEFETAGDDIDQPININGALYADDIVFQRDLADNLSGIDEPAERIFYNSSLILNSDSLPAEVTESKVYYILTE